MTTIPYHKLVQDKIKVYDNGNISVRFKFSDELRRIAEYIDLNTDTPAKVG